MGKIKLKKEKAATSSTYNKIQIKSPVNKSKMTSENGERKFIDVASQFVPGYETYLDVKDIVHGSISGNKEVLNRGVLGLGAPIAGKAISGGIDYLTEKFSNKKTADEIASKREGLINMSDIERINLFKKYGRGGYDKWVKEGKPKL